MFIPYISGAYEYEFCATADAKIDNLNVGRPGMKGRGGTAGIGLTTRKDNLSIDLSLEGYTGVREGLTGRLKLKYASAK
ncbi:MAG: hypothetical protein LBS81_00670 [Endomicrobium sp.]|jgi:hypothetical protein|nr:hypothetical protein [Endomicrobium sp.]